MNPFVAVVIPTLNEESHIRACVESLLLDSYPRDRLRIYVVDGGSRDRTEAEVEALAVRYPFVSFRHNRKRLQSAAFNLVMHEADDADYILRCDAHAVYPANFISNAVEAANESGAEVVVYSAIAKATTCFQRAVAFVQTTPLGVGGSEYRLGAKSLWVEHGWHGLFRRDAVVAVGGYDETFSHNEDSELSYRLHQKGGRCWLDSRLAVGYYPRSNPVRLARQFWAYGKGRCRTVMKHNTKLKLRQLAPVLLVPGAMLLLLLALLVSAHFLWPLVLYLLGLTAVSALGALRQRDPCLLLGAVAFPIVHFAWGAGFIRQRLAGI